MMIAGVVEAILLLTPCRILFHKVPLFSPIIAAKAADSKGLVAELFKEGGGEVGRNFGRAFH